MPLPSNATLPPIALGGRRDSRLPTMQPVAGQHAAGYGQNGPTAISNRFPGPHCIGNTSITLSTPLLYLEPAEGAGIGQISEYGAYGGEELINMLGAKLACVGNIIDVDGSTFATLKKADRAIRHTKELLFAGAPNQVVDVWMTNADNVAKRRERLLSQAGGQLSQILASGTGNCGEHSRVTQALILSEPTTQPVFRVRAAGVDHNFVIIGDPREKSCTEVVVADSWVTFPVAHLLSEGKFELGGCIEQTPPRSKIEPGEDVQRKVTKPIHVVDDHTKAQSYLKEKCSRGNTLYLHWVSAQILGQSYRCDGVTMQFDAFPRDWIENRINAYGEFYEWNSSETGT